jgi:hypothetical protein
LPNGTSYGAYAFAFANWGGSFYIFYYVEGLDNSTNVWKLDADGTLVKLIASVGWSLRSSHLTPFDER